MPQTLDITKKPILEPIVDCRANLTPSATKDNWYPKVYHSKIEFKDKPEWKGIVKVIKARDKHSCKSCGIKIGLDVHHIIPREEGGKDYPPNLITLCKICHNEIEFLGFRNRLQIIDFKQKRKYIKGENNIKTNNTTIKWQQWVYGGYRKPAFA